MGEQNGVTLEESRKTSEVLIMIVPFEKGRTFNAEGIASTKI